MKKIVCLIALFLMVAILCTSCGKQSTKKESDDEPKEAMFGEDPEEIKEKLIAAGYKKASVTTDQESLENAYGFNGMEAVVYSRWRTTPVVADTDSFDDWKACEGQTVVVDGIIIYYFESEKTARRAFEDASKRIEGSFESEANEFDAVLEDLEERSIFLDIEFEWGDPVLDGCTIYLGTSNAISDAS